MSVDYLSKIQEVARGRQRGPSTLWPRLKREWASLETELADQSRPYDVFSPGEYVRTKIRSLIELLYEFEVGGGPEADCEMLRAKDRAYGGSWQQRGGVGAFFVTVRKMDRLVSIVDKRYGGALETALAGEAGDPVEDLSDTIGDLRRYLILIEAWHVAKSGLVETMTTEGVGEIVSGAAGMVRAEAERRVPRYETPEISGRTIEVCNHHISTGIRCKQLPGHTGPHEAMDAQGRVHRAT